MPSATKKFGAVVMRAQPFHKGHQFIVDQIIADGLEPIVILGSVQSKITSKNPYTYLQRKIMVGKVYPRIHIMGIKDYYSYDEWLDQLQANLDYCTQRNPQNVTMYLNEKEEDLHDFTFQDVDYTEKSYCIMYDIMGMKTKSVPASNVAIRATSIRNDLEKHKKYLDAAVYTYIKDISK